MSTCVSRETVGAGPSILVVDDDDDVRLTLADVLELEGYRVTTANDGLEALAKLRGSKDDPQLVLLDMMMPRMDGAGVLRAMRDEGRVPRVPVVVLTAGRPANAELAGARLCLHKPVAYTTLVRVVARLASGEHTSSSSSWLSAPETNDSNPQAPR